MAKLVVVTIAILIGIAIVRCVDFKQKKQCDVTVIYIFGEGR